MQSYNDLQSQLKTIDHKSYPLYKSLRGSYQFPKYILSIDHVQGDPFAAPSDVRVTVDAKAAGFPAFAMKDKLTRTALADELLRNFAAKVNQFNFKAKGSGKSGLKCCRGQHVKSVKKRSPPDLQSGFLQMEERSMQKNSKKSYLNICHSAWSSLFIIKI